MRRKGVKKFSLPPPRLLSFKTPLHPVFFVKWLYVELFSKNCLLIFRHRDFNRREKIEKVFQRITALIPLAVSLSISLWRLLAQFLVGRCTVKISLQPSLLSPAVISPVRTVFKIIALYVQEVVTLQKKYLIYLHQKMRFTPFINYYDPLGWILFVYRAK